MSRVKTRCEESHMDEQERIQGIVRLSFHVQSSTHRIQAAISMTLCELATARHYAPPMECAAFSKGQQSPPSGHVQAACVEYTFVSSASFRHSAAHVSLYYDRALSRSAQFWSSYSGYLRELRKLDSSCMTVDISISMMVANQRSSVLRSGDGWTLVSLGFD